jgi:hypothetical protein
MLTAHAVRYTNEYPSLMVPFDNLSPSAFTEICATTKATEWSYEREYQLLRTVGHRGPPPDPSVNGDFIMLPEKSVVGLTIGAKMNPTDVDRLLDVAKANGLPVWHAHLHDREFRLRFQRLC